MKKFYSIIALLTAFTVGTWADVTPIVSGTKIITIGDAVTDLSTLSDDAYYVLQSQGTSTYYYETNDNKIANGTSNSSAITTDYLVKITKSSNTTGNYYTIQAASGNYYQALNTTSTQLTTGEESSDYLIISQSSNWFFRQVINGQNYNINNYGHQPYGATGTGAFSQIKIYSATLSDAVTITWTINYGDNKRTTYTQKAEPNSTVSCDASYPFTTITGSVNVGTEDCTDNATATFNTPFTASTDYATATWYYLKSGRGTHYAYYNNSNSNVNTNTSKTNTEDYKWAFIGNPIDGYKVINKASGESKYVYAANGSNNTMLSLSDTETTWQIVDGSAQAAKTFTFYLNGTQGGYWNSYDNQSAIGMWQESVTDNGSRWLVEDAPATEYSDLTAYNTTLNLANNFYDNFDDNTNLGTGIGQYSGSNKAELKEVIDANSGKTQNDEQSDIDAATAALTAAINKFTITTPTTAKFYKFRSANSNGYLTSPAIGSSDQFSASKTDADETTIWFCTTSHNGANNGIISYTAGEYIHPTNRSLTTTANWNGYDWMANTSTVGTYTIFNKSGGYKPLNSTEDGVVGNGTWNNNVETTQKQYAWYIEEVTSLPVTMHQSGSNYYATVCVPVATTVNGATAYYVSSLSDNYQTEGGYATLTEFTDGIIPANTAAILIGTDSIVSLEVSEQTGTEVTSSLAGSFTATRPSTDNYYFGQKGGTAGFYAVTNIPADKYISNTAWLAGNSASSSKGFTFVFGDNDPTGINNATAEDAIKTNGVRYNVQGQRVGEGYKGIVIINGKKYLIK